MRLLAGCMLLPLLFILKANPQGSTVTITVTGLKSGKGKIIAALYHSEVGFPTSPKSVFKRLTSVVKESRSVLTFENIPNGVYAVAFFHDRNNNGKLDTNFMGIPTEGTGASNNAEGFLGPPKFKDAKFTVTGNFEQEVKIEN